VKDSRFPIPRKLVTSPTLLHGRPVKRLSRGGGWLIAVVTLVGACARAGEDVGPSDDAQASTVIDAATGDSPDEASDLMSSSGGGDSDLGAEDAGLDGDAAPQSLGEDAAETADATETADAADTGSDATVADAMAIRDASPVADVNAPVVDTGAPPPPTCAQTCKVGCCDSAGSCIESSDTTCGASGAACHDCTAAGQTCQSGACVSPPPSPDAGGPSQPPDAGGPSQDAGGPSQPPDAGGPTCQASSCTNLCVPYFVQCCKADDTCGCALFFPPGSCN
jgi:hypothetical protein